MPLTCWIKNCPRSRNTIQRFLDHLRNGHSIHHSFVEVRCGQEGCPATFVGFRALKRHLIRHHSHLETCPRNANSELISDANQCSTSSASAADHYVDETDVGSECEVDDSCDIDITASCMSFLGQLQCKANVSMANVQFASQCVNDLLGDVAKYASNRVKQLCRDTNIDMSIAAAESCLSDLSQLPRFLSPIETEHQRSKYLVQKGYLIEPQTLDLGQRTETRFMSKVGYNKTVVVPDTMQYIPVEKLLCALLNDPYYSRLISECGVKLDRDDDAISHFFHTKTYLQHPFFRAHPDALALHIFIDGFEVTNPLGSHTSIHKMEGLYMLVQNLPAEIQSKLSSIFLVAMWHAQDVKKYGYDRILQPVLSAMQQLETDRGMTVTVDSSVTTVRASLVLVSADNLGFNSLFGFYESFTATRFCRFCECTRDQAEMIYDEECVTLRTRNSYDLAVSNCQEADYDARRTGIKRPCVLNNLKYFHVVENFVVDAMHDILEGIAPFEVALVLVELANSKYLTVDNLNQVLVSFNYSLSDKNSQPPSLSALHLVKMSASEMWCFLRNMPLMIGAQVPRDDKHWQLILMLLDIIDIVFAPKITVPLSIYLKRLVSDHHAYFRELFPDKRLLPKHHFLIHYPRCLAASGPPVRYWCMRFEARHKYFKDVAAQSHCYVNIGKTLAKRFH